MRQISQSPSDNGQRAKGTGVSRRAAVSTSGLALLGVLAGSTLGQEQAKETVRKEFEPRLPKQIQEQMEKSKAFSERFRHAGSAEERQKIMDEHMTWERQRAIEDLKDQLDVSDQEWAVIKPRIEAVYRLVHPAAQMGPASGQIGTEVDQKSSALRELLRDKAAGADQIKARLTALRAAREKVAQGLVRARQDLRQLMTLRQEAVLVLNGLLD